ncbi:hypothetical protein ECG_07593 [Echinococcus granulosus]|uniref:Expressed protein n=1 Tax=Echinococcus granulosus TaxID=6210 RepID=U6JQI7_ECHGR|nr:hypothetical protein EGR_07129 [Echinococcus granulosus]EUB58023.1 hypothetical protein EGR_07129 [Echinococcus granulosus]KAH9279613.1 hypothetical protein ECG_07593 [Echinococcus granulosus]CDS24142.1 expressed protein [Echinococcus granulosus]
MRLPTPQAQSYLHAPTPKHPKCVNLDAVVAPTATGLVTAVMTAMDMIVTTFAAWLLHAIPLKPASVAAATVTAVDARGTADFPGAEN